MGIKFKLKGLRTEVVEDITCDICGCSTLDDMKMNFEYAELMADWGYGSRRDTESWDYFLCEDHAEKVKDFIEKLREGQKILNET